jgi:hypothetical protein
MTMRGFGNVVPIQIAMLRLAGYVVEYRGKRIRPAASDRERRRTMREGLEELRETTGQDFGYDLAAWRDYLMRDTDHGYTHPYAFQNVDPAILESIADRRRQETAEQLQREDDAGGPAAEAGAARLLPTQRFMLELAGFVLSRTGGLQPAKSEEQRKQAMRRGLEGLRQCTGHDWGYDLLVWHQVLLACDKAYAQTSARDGYERLILQAIADEQRQRSAEELTQEREVEEREVKLRPMTVQGFGQVVPIQIAMLKLAGYVPDHRDERLRAASSEAEREWTLREGLDELCESTGQDFGYDLAAWREYLLEHEESGYAHADSFEAVDLSVVEAISDRCRQETAEWLKEEDEDEEADGWSGTRGPELFPTQFFMLDLAGLAFTGEGRFEPAKTEQKRKRAMRRGRRELRQITGQDFGYDLAAWHEYLLAHDEGYSHPYAREGFEQFILDAVVDAERQRLAAELAQEDSRN